MTSPAPRRLGLYIPWALFALACFGWRAYWFAAKDAAVKALAAQVTRADAAGLDAGYTRVDAGGFPLHLTLTMQDAHVTPFPHLRIAAARLPLSVNLSNPRHLILGLADGVTWTTSDGVNHKLDAAKAEASVRFGADNKLARASLAVEDARIAHGSTAPTRIGTLLIHVRPDPRNGADAQVVVDAEGWDGPTPFAALDGLSPYAHFRAAVVATDAGSLISRKPLQTWTGALRIESLDVAAAAQVSGTGDLRLDAAHRPAGALHLTPTSGPPMTLLAENGWWTLAGVRLAASRPLYSD